MSVRSRARRHFTRPCGHDTAYIEKLGQPLIFLTKLLVLDLGEAYIGELLSELAVLIGVLPKREKIDDGLACVFGSANGVLEERIDGTFKRDGLGDRKGREGKNKNSYTKNRSRGFITALEFKK